MTSSRPTEPPPIQRELAKTGIISKCITSLSIYGGNSFATISLRATYSPGKVTPMGSNPNIAQALIKVNPRHGVFTPWPNRDNYPTLNTNQRLIIEDEHTLDGL